MQNKNVRILGTGKYLPSKVVTAEEMDRILNVNLGWVAKHTKVLSRHYVENETASEMAAKAAQLALTDAGLTVHDIDCIVSVSGVNEQAIPSNGALFQEALGWQDSRIPAFDINSTCLSFVTGLDVISYMIQGGRYKNVLMISSEIASVGLNLEQKESTALFGDGAVAVIVGATETNSKIISAKMETFSAGAHFTEIRGGGNKIHPREYNEKNKADFLFDMNGRAVFKLSMKVIDSFVEGLFHDTGLTIDDIDLVIPHQASGLAMEKMKSHLGVSDEKFMSIIHNHGNTIAASIPMTLHEAIKQGKLKRGDKALLIGTSAGLSLGGIILEY